MLPTHQFLYENAHVLGDCVVIVRLQVESVLWYLLIECIVHWQLILSCLCDWLGVHLGVRKCFVSFSLVVFVYTCACVCLHEKRTWLRVCVLVFVCAKNGPDWEQLVFDYTPGCVCLYLWLCLFAPLRDCLHLCLCLFICVLDYASACICDCLNLCLCLFTPLLVFVNTFVHVCTHLYMHLYTRLYTRLYTQFILWVPVCSNTMPPFIHFLHHPPPPLFSISLL